MQARIEAFIDANITDSILVSFLKSLLYSTLTNEQLLTVCILIEVQNGFLREDDLTSVIAKVAARGLVLNYKNFTETAEVAFRESTASAPPFSRVLTLPVFVSYVGTFRHSRLEIDPAKIGTVGWSARNGVVWVTPTAELAAVVGRASTKPFPADDVCDHVGIARNNDLAATRSPSSVALEWVEIRYPHSFPDVLFQPNSTNANWDNPDLLYLSFPKGDGWGRTYNETGIAVARERVHGTSFFFDPSFSAEALGGMSVNIPIRSSIIDEGCRRLGV
jgi:hypothetical protein